MQLSFAGVRPPVTLRSTPDLKADKSFTLTFADVQGRPTSRIDNWLEARAAAAAESTTVRIPIDFALPSSAATAFPMTVGGLTITKPQLQPLAASYAASDTAVEVIVDARGSLVVTGNTSAGPKKLRWMRLWVITMSDDKDSEEPVGFEVTRRDNGQILFQTGVGKDVKWDNYSTHMWSFNTPSVSAASCIPANFHVHKFPDGSATGHGWEARFQLDSYFSSGFAATPFMTTSGWIGDGHPYDVIIPFSIC
jgi:hypothetical protein